MPAARLTCLLAAAAALAVACSGGGGERITRGTEPVFTTTTTVRSDDGVLRLGLLRDAEALPAVDSSIANAAKIAVAQINSAGGVGGQPVSLVEAGGATLTAKAAIGRLVDNDVDAIIGPLSSTDALSDLSSIVGRGVLSCSPTAAALALDAYPDEGLFFRTIPSDSLEAAAIATAVEQAGAPNVSLAYLDDGYGRPFAEAVLNELLARGLTVHASIAFSITSVDQAARRLADGQSSVLVVIADQASGPTLIAAVDQLLPVGQPVYFVNDAQRHPKPQQPLNEAIFDRITVISPATTPADESLTQAIQAVDPATTAAFAANSFDCVNLIALAALSAGSTVAGDIAGNMVAVSTSGSKCVLFDACRSDLADGRNIDYDGASRVLALGSNGDPTRALFERVKPLPDGHDSVIDRFAVSARNAGP